MPARELKELQAKFRHLMNPRPEKRRGIRFTARLDENSTPDGPASQPGNTRKSPN